MDMDIQTESVVKTNFERGYEMLPMKHQIDVRNDIMRECGWTALMTFHNKRRGLRRIFKLEIPVIEKHFAKYNLDAWTGEYLT